MSYYLELLEKHGKKLNKEQKATRNALSYAYKPPKRKTISKLREEMDKLIQKRSEKK